MIKTFTHSLFLALASFALPAWADEPAPLFNVTYNDAEASVAQALSDKGAGIKIAASITGQKGDAIFSYSKPLSVEVRGITFDKPSGHWSANLLAMADGEVVTAIPAAGHFDEMIEVPVLKREVRTGETIGAADVEIRDFPITRTRNDTVTDIDALLGKAPLRTISPFRPVRDHEIAEPTMIKKNTLVQMRYVSPGMSITTVGQALAEGARGSVIPVRNTASKKIVQGVVEDANTVSVGPSTPNTQAVSMTVQPGDSYAAN